MPNRRLRRLPLTVISTDGRLLETRPIRGDNQRVQNPRCGGVLEVSDAGRVARLVRRRAGRPATGTDSPGARLLPRYMENLIAVAPRNGARLVVLDNVYMLGGHKGSSVRSLESEAGEMLGLCSANRWWLHDPAGVCAIRP
jgi:hypothetical protein